MRVFSRTVLLIGLLFAAASANAQNAPAHRDIPLLFDKLLSARLDANVHTSIALAVEEAGEAYAAADQAHGFQPLVAKAVTAAQAAAAKAEDNVWGYGVDDLGFERYAGEMKDGILQQGAGVTILHPKNDKDTVTTETDGAYTRVRASDGSLMYFKRGSQYLAEYFAPDGGYFAGYATVYSMPAFPPHQNGGGVFYPGASKPESEMAGQFRDGQLDGSAIVRMRDGSVIAGSWAGGKLNGNGAKFDARGRVTEQGTYFSGERVTADFEAPAPGLTLPVLTIKRDCNEDFYPPLSVRMNEQGDVDVMFVIGTNGEPGIAGILKSSGRARLDDAARKCVLAWRYTPAQFKSKPVSYLSTVTLQMRILHPILGVPPP